MWDFYEVDQKQGHHKKRKRVLKRFMDRTKNLIIFIIIITITTMMMTTTMASTFISARSLPVIGFSSNQRRVSCSSSFSRQQQICVFGGDVSRKGRYINERIRSSSSSSSSNDKNNVRRRGTKINRERQRGRAAIVNAAGHGHAHGSASSTERRSGENKGFVEEMRFVAMKLHTREQAPKEGKKKAEKVPEQKPMAQWQPTKEGYLKFLVESKAVYDAMEAIVASNADPMYNAFIDCGLERSEALDKDIQWFRETLKMEVPEAKGAGKDYADFLNNLAKESPPRFLCHFYNVYFAHSAGGKMIGRKVSEMILDGKELEFYIWNKNGGLEKSLAEVKENLNEAAEKWTREEKDICLEETSKSFQLSGALLRLIA